MSDLRQLRLEAVRRAAEESTGLLAVYLFGSARVEGAQPRDLDIALIFADAVPASERWRIADDVAARLERTQPDPALAVDVIDLAEAPPALQLRALSEGLLAYESDPVARIRFVTRTASMAIDFVEWQRPYLEQWLKGVADGR